MGARQYDPLLGRFTTVDPVMDLTDPQQWHGYAYANSNPVTFSDPTGLALTECAGTCNTNGGNGRVAVPTAGGRHKVTGPKPIPPSPPITGSSPALIMAESFVERGYTITRNGNAGNGTNTWADLAATQFSSGCQLYTQQVVCFGWSPGGDQPLTYGDVLFWPRSRDNLERRLSRERSIRVENARQYGWSWAWKHSRNILAHEAVHSDQQAGYPLGSLFVAAYAKESAKSLLLAGNVWERNAFEQEANLYWGGNKTAKPPDYIEPGTVNAPPWFDVGVPPDPGLYLQHLIETYDLVVT